jgi:excinuclease ABC subunit C
MVVFTNGIADKGQYRKFKMRVPGNDDFAHMREVILRRFSEKNVKAWGKPSLLLIDGGKGQLHAALGALHELGIEIPAIGLAKQFEDIVVAREWRLGNSDSMMRGSNVNISASVLHRLPAVLMEDTSEFQIVHADEGTHVIKLLQRIRDESHRFAITYHGTLKRARQTVSWLDTIPTIGPGKKKILLRTFGSVRGVLQARGGELEACVGDKSATILRQYIRAENKGLKDFAHQSDEHESEQESERATDQGDSEGENPLTGAGV